MTTNPILEILAKSLVSAHSKNSRLGSVDAKPMPALPSVAAIVDRLREVLFPCIAAKPGGNAVNCEEQIKAHLHWIEAELQGQIECALEFQATSSPKTLAQQIAHQFLSTLPEISKTLMLDIEAAYQGDPAATSYAEIVYTYPGVQAVTIYRMAHQLLRLGVPLIPRMMCELAHSRTGIDIHPGATIGHGFFIDHGTGVVIGETCTIGDNVRIYQGVTLGALSFPRDAQGELIRGQKRHPTIEHNVVIYANATILGGETVIGHDSIIGSSVWVNQCVTPYTIVTVEKPTLRFVGPGLKMALDFQI